MLTHFSNLGLHRGVFQYCYCAATAIDGNTAIFLISGYEERNLGAEGRLVKDKQFVSIASRVLGREDETDTITPHHVVKPRR